MTGGHLDEMLGEEPYGPRRRPADSRRGGEPRRGAGRFDDEPYASDVPERGYDSDPREDRRRRDARREGGRGAAGDAEADYPDSGYADDYADDRYPGDRYPGDRYPDGRYPDDGAADDEFARDDVFGAAGFDDDEVPAGEEPGRGRRGRRRSVVHGGDADDGGAGGVDWDDDPPPRRRTRALPKLVAVLVVVAALLGLGIFAVGKVVGRIGGGGGSAADYTGAGNGIAVIQIPDGASARQIAQELRDANVTASVAAFVKAASANPKSLGIQPGTYRLRSQMSADAALAALLDPASSAPFRFTIKEGETVRQVLAGLHDRLGTPMDELQAIANNPRQLGVPAYAPTLEGYLFPSTYDLVPGATPLQLLTSFVTRFKSETASIDLENKAAARNMKPADIVTVASIIEKEVANADEGPKVARVVYNRLNDTTGAFRTLGMDSTTRYAQNEYTGPLTRSQLVQKDNPYNTRVNPGLPPGGISNPGLWALKSALAPADGTWLWFISMPRSGVTEFATTRAEFDRLYAQYLAEGGKE
ncbi:endolytic transglycosylase MltG [Frankia sp. AgB32]|uniref:endolytic transglycosylase MltG n=1 Tax=Frankia sp. AgB32 TaxID=631119 RepID=UPI00200CB772|nr:endolytic transglycosylase MltG [Frankia sp. AgB32]MCK9897465.1 endolytic transglycosylase MltG [Frankia sp. AgB32]